MLSRNTLIGKTDTTNEMDSLRDTRSSRHDGNEFKLIEGDELHGFDFVGIYERRSD